MSSSEEEKKIGIEEGTNVEDGLKDEEGTNIELGS
jgi:hypothetical protein